MQSLEVVTSHKELQNTNPVDDNNCTEMKQEDLSSKIKNAKATLESSQALVSELLVQTNPINPPVINPNVHPIILTETPLEDKSNASEFIKREESKSSTL